jgi:hypothetical protein
MSGPAPWHLLRSKPKEHEEPKEFAGGSVWICPPYIQLERHVKFYRDLVKSTEKVELTLSHSGKAEVTVCGDSPAEPDNKNNDPKARQSSVILVPLRCEHDPRLPFIDDGGRLDTRPEFKDPENLVRILLNRRQQLTPHGSRSVTPSSSPKQAEAAAGEPILKRPPPPAAPPGMRPPPPPKAPPIGPPEKRLRL